MDLEKMFSENVIRQVSTVVIPGAIAIAPVISWIIHENGASLTSLSDVTAMLGCALLSIAAGIIIDDVSIRIESEVVDRFIDWKTKGRHLKEWTAYLQLSFDSASILQKAIETTWVKMRFESSLTVSIIWFLVSSLILNQTYGISENCQIWASVFIGALACYTGFEALSSAWLLSSRRHDLLDNMRKIRDEGATRARG